MKTIAQIVIFIFVSSLTMPTLSWFVKDVEKCYSFCDIDKSEKELDNSEEKELDKNELDFFDKIFFSEKFYFKTSINDDELNLFHFLSNHNIQFKEIFSPPPELV
ncbi:hypothetical protein [Flavobacterium sp.]|uniref:hypothetical protein n=1 Tax=Flavobacterium sp. TaxID=239 RepID=UPI0037C18650